MTTASAVEKVGDRVASQAVAPARHGNTVYDVINAQRAEIERALPKHLDADRLLRIAITQVRQTPQLAECSQQSLLAAIMLSAQLGLEPGPLGHCWLIPRRIKGKWEVQWQLGYKGIIDLARRSGQLVSIEANDVREGDEFEFSYGLDPVLRHSFDLRSERGAAYAYYGVAHFKDGGRYFLVMSKAEVDRRKARSAAANADFSPWKTDYDAMARKTVIRAMAPYLPLSAEIVNAVNADGRVRTDFTPPAEPTFIEGTVVDEDEEPPRDDPPTTKGSGPSATELNVFQRSIATAGKKAGIDGAELDALVVRATADTASPRRALAEVNDPDEANPILAAIEAFGRGELQLTYAEDGTPSIDEAAG